MFYVKYRRMSGLVLREGRTEYEDARTEAEDCIHAGHQEVEILIDLATADVNLDGAAAPSRRLPLPGTARRGRSDDDTETET